MDPIRVELADIREDHGASVVVDGTLELPQLVIGDVTFVLVEPARFSAVVTNTGTGYVASGDVSALVTTECSRCLQQFEMTLTGAIEGFYVEPGHNFEIPEEQETEPVTDGGIDLAPALLAALVLEAPFAPVHDPECPGICPGCGVDLNEAECTCAEDGGVASPFAALKELLPEEPKGED